MKPIACIRNEAEDSMGLAPAAFEAAGMPVRTVEACLGEALPNPVEIGAVAVFGGSMNVDDVATFPYLEVERGFLQDCLGRGVPVLGVCLGAQVLARALGQPVFRLPSRRLGFSTVTPTAPGRDDPLVASFAPGPAFHWNEDAFELPAGAVALASGPEDQVEAFRLGSATWGLVFHPEVTEEELKVWMDLTQGLEETWRRSREELESEILERLPEHRDRGSRLLEAFAAFVRDRAG